MSSIEDRANEIYETFKDGLHFDIYRHETKRWMADQFAKLEREWTNRTSRGKVRRDRASGAGGREIEWT